MNEGKDVIVSLQLLANKFKDVTRYMLGNRIMYIDEVFGADGFLPLIARIAERDMLRSLGNTGLKSGFSYVPDGDALFCERLEVMPAENGLYCEDHMRSLMLEHASREVVGLGQEGTLDLTPVYQFFTALKREDRNALRQVEELSWPMYQSILVS